MSHRRQRTNDEAEPSIREHISATQDHQASVKANKKSQRAIIGIDGATQPTKLRGHQQYHPTTPSKEDGHQQGPSRTPLSQSRRRDRQKE
jgi:hypothetical protein